MSDDVTCLESKKSIYKRQQFLAKIATVILIHHNGDILLRATVSTSRLAVKLYQTGDIVRQRGTG